MEDEELIIYESPKSPIAEVFRTLRTNLQFMTSNKELKTLLVTSSLPGEGKSWVSANLIMAFAQEGKKVLIIDADMRKGRLHKIFKIDKKPGLSNYLSGVVDLKKGKDNILNYIKQTTITNLYVMPTGDIPPNPSELLVSEKTKELISNVKNMFDIVIFDATPSLIVTDAIILAREVDATLIVTAHKVTKMGDVEKIKKSIENVGGKIAGIVINKISMSTKQYNNTYYYGENSQDKKEKETKNLNNKNMTSEESSKEHKNKKDTIKKNNHENEDIKEQKKVEKIITTKSKKKTAKTDKTKKETNKSTKEEKLKAEIEQEIKEFKENAKEKKKEVDKK